MRNVRMTLWVMLVLLFSTSLLQATVEITFTEDGIIQEGDYYDIVYVYGDGTTVEITGGYACEIYMYDSSTINMIGGEAGGFQMDSNSGSTVNVRGGRVSGRSAGATRVNNGCTFNMSGGMNDDTGGIACYGGTINISGGKQGLVLNASGGGTVNITGGDGEELE